LGPGGPVVVTHATIPETSEIHKDLSDEIDQAFANVDLALRTAGGKGWCQVYKINLYLTVMNEEAVGALVRNLKKWMPDHQPVMTAVGVAALGLGGNAGRGGGGGA
ncbi:hypothetical protein P885DRAFT_82215, partial [Corynascus similis CBS 632.67]